MLTSQRVPSQGMGSMDEELSAMLQSGHHSHGQTSLASVLTPSMTPITAAGSGDLFASQYSSLRGSFPVAGGQGQQHKASARNMSLQKAAGLAGRGLSGRSSTSQAPRWPFANNEKWVLDAKNEALEASSTLRSSVDNFGPHVDAPTRVLNPPPPLSGGLQRYHSAPSSFLQCLADFNEDSFSQVSSPLGDRDGLLNCFFSDTNLTPIIECAPQHMDTEKVVTSSSLNDYERFLASQHDFSSRRSALTAPVPSGKPEPRSIARSDGLGVSAAPDSLGVRSRSMKNSLIRQSSSPADLLAAIQDSMGESDPPTLQIPAILSPDESLSGGTSEENVGGTTGKTSMYSRDDGFLVNDVTVASGGLWNNPPSPGNLGGTRLRVPGDMTNGPGLPGDGSLRIRVGEPGSLTRHQSLPMASRPLSPTMDMSVDDLADFSVPCKTRAKRGFATHPRSIAERVRRTRISERMKKLQDLVPNMDRQTNTADMLDEAVEYVKQLQLQVQELSNTVVQLKELQQAKELKAQG